jgi:hypothetical protein
MDVVVVMEGESDANKERMEGEVFWPEKSNRVVIRVW